jgi:PncC family amidohydrolase
MNNDSLAQDIARELANREEKLVFAESCTAGMLASTLGQIPGVSKNLCGSAVTYRADLKRRWLGVKRRTIKRHTTESGQVAAEMALGALRHAPKADWSCAVVGHMGPDAPEDKDGQMFVCIARRTKKGNLKIKDKIEYQCKADGRVRRMEEVVEVVFTQLARVLRKKTAIEHQTPDDTEVKHESKGTRRKVVGAP